MTQDGAPSETTNSGDDSFGFHLDPRIDALDPPWTEDTFSAPDVADAYCHAWEILKVIFAGFWTPVQHFALGAVRQSRMDERLDWLRPVELMLRRIIFIEAQARARDLPDPKPLRPSRPHKPAPGRTCPSTAPTPPPGASASPISARPSRADPPARTSRSPNTPHGRLQSPSRASMAACSIRRRWRTGSKPSSASAPLRGPASRARPQLIRTPRTLATLNRLGAILGLDTLKRRDSS